MAEADKGSKGGNRKLRKYDQAFKQEALKMLQSGRSAKEVSEVLGVSEQTLYNWRSLDRSRYQSSDNDDLRQTHNEVEQLRKRLREVEMERDILKKALSIFSRGT